MPNRIIKDSINESRGLSECSIFAGDLYKRLITYADDYGRFNADTTIMRARLFPMEYESITEQDIIDGLVELAGVGKIGFYMTNRFGQLSRSKGVYGAFPNWSNHQRQRDTKAKCPEPDDTTINDWYLRRFVPMDMKVAIVERDNFKCRECGKFLTSCRDARRFVKLGQGLFHIDHIVPVVQGGRATLENLRLTCPECNLKRKKSFTFREVIDFTLSPQFAADCGNSPQITADCRKSRPESNPIQSNPNPESNPNPTPNPTRAGAVAAVCGYYLDRVNPSASQTSLEELSAYAENLGEDVCKRAIDIALDNKKATWPYIRGILRRLQSQGVKCLADFNAAERKHDESVRASAITKNNGKATIRDFEPSAERIARNGEWLDAFLSTHGSEGETEQRNLGEHDGQRKDSH